MLQPIFFHNKHDKVSRDEINKLPSEIKVIDVFGGDNIPEGYKVSKLPYLVDKELMFITPEPLYVPDPVPVYDENGDPVLDESGNQVYKDGTLTLSWEILDSGGNKLSIEPKMFITINGETHDEICIAGKLDIDLIIGSPIEFDVEIFNEFDGVHPWRRTLEVVEKSG